MVLLSSEWLTIDPEELGRFTKVHPLDLLLGLCLKMTLNGPFDAAMGYSRQDRRVDEMALRYGVRLMGTVERFKIPCSIVFCQQGSLRNHPVRAVQSRVDQLWSDRIENKITTYKEKVA